MAADVLCQQANIAMTAIIGGAPHLKLIMVTTSGVVPIMMISKTLRHQSRRYISYRRLYAK
jgi:hypothetical protein